MNISHRAREKAASIVLAVLIVHALLLLGTKVLLENAMIVVNEKVAVGAAGMTWGGERLAGGVDLTLCGEVFAIKEIN